MAKIPLYNTDIVPPRNRPELTGLTDSDIFIVEDLADNKIKKLTKANAKDTLGIDNIDSRLTTLEGSGSGSVQDQIDTAIDDLAGAGRTTETVKGNADAIAQIQDNKVTAFQETPDDTHYPSEKLVDDSLKAIKGVEYTGGTLKSHEDRLDTLEGTGEGSVKQAIDDAVSPIDTRVTYLENELVISTPMDLEAFGGKTYGDIFVTNNFLPYGDFESGLDWVTTSTNNPTISDEAYSSKSHSLKCFGISSVQIRKDMTVSASSEVAVLAKVRVDRYVSGGGAGFVVNQQAVSENTLINRVTDGFETLYYRRVLKSGSAISVFCGTISSANCDAYIDDFAIIDLTTLFGTFENFPSQAELTQLYNDWIKIKNGDKNRLDLIETDITAVKSDITAINEKLPVFTTKPMFVGAIMGASSGANRFAAMRQLYQVAQKIIDNPDYESSDTDLTYANCGAVCLLPQYPSGMYQSYPFDILYSKNGTTQAIPASTTKVMTLVTGLDYLTDMYERTTIVADDIQDGSSSILSISDVVTVTDLMYGMLLPSSNTCAMAFARVCGEKILKSQDGELTHTATECQNAFVSAMATKATNLGMTNSTFVSPSGRSESNLTTVVDMLKFIIEACSYPVIEKIWNKKSYTISVGGDNARDIDIATTLADSSLESLYYIFGGKTGTLILQQTSIALIMVGQAK